MKKIWALLLLTCVVSLAVISGRTLSAVPVLAGAQPGTSYTLIIDAGHGGEDGGAVSLTGVAESRINLEIALRLESL